jgi:hypothetical protein
VGVMTEQWLINSFTDRAALHHLIRDHYHSMAFEWLLINDLQLDDTVKLLLSRDYYAELKHILAAAALLLTHLLLLIHMNCTFLIKLLWSNTL